MRSDVLEITSVADAVYRHLGQLVVRELAPGQPLKLHEIAVALGVSTTPVRLALERLAADGLVTQAGRKGASVAPLSLADFADIYAVRRGLESTAARLGAPTLTANQVRRIRTQFQHLTREVGSSPRGLGAYLDVEWEMHLIVYRAAGHTRLLNEIEAYRRLAERYFRLALLKGANLDIDLKNQRMFYEACADRDGEVAESVISRLLEWTVEQVTPLILDPPAGDRE